jgi:hypothetical protein
MRVRNFELEDFLAVCLPEGQLGPTGQANNRQLLTTTCLESGSDHILLYQVYRQVLHPKENETN